ncbi:hypothetical protein T552_03369 [Pneumocystis carinii B80]|uniref:Copper-fist domain-containing protein n=1 Tax=Pneumocystis carinii (strain B80) TaxID=1408658 RepID=A0A0W4ZBQ5_PNEC8|nr:hypothetical protein T552_03369 [Pneumocystis carinii B80]KTW25756.1 hypothetical protein T552_03369 [Pneumocystis carinii B80]
MVYINDIKYACSSCIRGHRSSLCDHENRQLFEIKRKGRPVSQCVQMPTERTKKGSKTRCICHHELGESFVSLDVEKMALKMSKKNRKKISPMMKNERGFCDIEKDQGIRNSVQIYSFPTDYNTLNNSLQWIHLPEVPKTPSNIDIKAQEARFEPNGLYDSDSVFCSQNLGSELKPTEMIHEYPQYMCNYQMNFYQTCDKSAYTHFDSVPIYPYMRSDIGIDSRVFTSEFVGCDQYLKMQNNDNTKIPELLTDPQIMISNDYRNFNSEILDISYPYLLSKVGFDYLFDSTCESSNCHINTNNIPQNVLQTMSMDRKLLLGLYTNPK